MVDELEQEQKGSSGGAKTVGVIAGLGAGALTAWKGSKKMVSTLIGNALNDPQGSDIKNMFDEANNGGLVIPDTATAQAKTVGKAINDLTADNGNGVLKKAKDALDEVRKSSKETYDNAVAAIPGGATPADTAAHKLAAQEVLDKTREAATKLYHNSIGKAISGKMGLMDRFNQLGKGQKGTLVFGTVAATLLGGYIVTKVANKIFGKHTQNVIDERANAQNPELAFQGAAR